ncbi:Cysteine protease family c01a, partial [Globisporangium splendens]
MNLLTIAAALALAAAKAHARPMHAAIEPHYHRYLEERADMQVEYEAWMNKFKGDASTNGWIPVSEARSADEEQEDHLQRFFLTKQRIKEMELENPDAQFSTDSPFTLLTDEEFNAYVGNAYRKAEQEATRRLRSSHSYTDYDHRGNWDQARSTDSTETTTAPATSNHKSNRKSNGWSYSYSWTTDGNGNRKAKDFQWSGSLPSNWGDWMSWWNKWKSGGSNNGNNNQPSGGSSNYEPPATVAPYNPATSAPETAAPETSAPETAAPETAAPGTAAPETAAPSDGGNNLPVAPEYPAETEAPAATPSPLTMAPQTDAPASSKDTTGYDFDTATDAPVAAEASTQGSSGYIDWTTSPCMSPIQNQGQCGSCWAFASIAAVESAQCIAGGQKSQPKYSEQQLASCDTKNFGCNGGAPTYAFQYIQQNGLCTEQAYPYTLSNGGSAQCNANCQKTDPGVKGSTRVTGEDGLLSALAQHPVVVAVAAGNNAWKQYQGGILSACDTSQVDHAVVVVGYDADTIKIRNSWGERWGEKGYIRLRRGIPGVGTCGLFTDMSHPTM